MLWSTLFHSFTYKFVGFTLERCKEFSNGTTIYFVGEPHPYIQELKENFKEKYFKDCQGVFRKLLTFKSNGIIIDDFRTDLENGEVIIRQEGDGADNITALYYNSPNGGDNIFRVYCIWPVLNNERIIIVGGGGGLKMSGGTLQQYPELMRANEKMRDLSGALKLGYKHGKIKIENNKLIGGFATIHIIN